MLMEAQSLESRAFSQSICSAIVQQRQPHIELMVFAWSLGVRTRICLCLLVLLRLQIAPRFCVWEPLCYKRSAKSNGTEWQFNAKPLPNVQAKRITYIYLRRHQHSTNYSATCVCVFFFIVVHCGVRFKWLVLRNMFERQFMVLLATLVGFCL